MMVVVLLGIGVLVVNAYTTDGSGVASTMGHSADEIDGLGTLAMQDSVSWSDVSGIPAGFADGVDDVSTAGSTANEWTTESGSCYDILVYYANTMSTCNPGYAITGVEPGSGGWGSLRSVRCCKLR